MKIKQQQQQHNSITQKATMHITNINRKIATIEQELTSKCATATQKTNKNHREKDTLVNDKKRRG